MAARVSTLEAEKAAELLEAALRKKARTDLTIADAAAAGGIALREAEAGLHHLVSKYRGTLSATEKGELLFRFPHGFTLPITKRPGFVRFFERAKKAVVGVSKLVVRAWLTIVVVGYVGVFLAIALAIAFSGRDENGRGFGLVSVLFRVILEALFWTFHPFSPFATRHAWDDRSRRRSRFDRDEEEKAPFYERVNRFVFGPEPEKVDARELERRIIAQIRAGAGRIGIGDILRVTGLPREEADPLMARIMLDYEGDVSVSDDGGIFYTFPALRKTAASGTERAPPAVWSKKTTAPPVTGNDSGSNVLIAALNGFNLIASWIALQTNLTIDRVTHILEQAGSRVPLPPLPYDGVPLALGLIPFVFSAVLFAMPIGRWATEAGRKRKAAAENARRAVLRTVMEKTQAGTVVNEDMLMTAWKSAAGEAPTSEQLSAEVAALGGDVDMDTSAEKGRAQYRFRDLEAEVAALKKERAEAKEEEKDAGAVVFRSDS